MNKILDIRRVIIAPKYEKNIKNYYFNCGVIDEKIIYDNSHEWLALYWDDKTNKLYDLSNKFKEIKSLESGLIDEEYLVDLKKMKYLTEFFKNPIYKFDIKYNDLLYVVEPIIIFQKYLHNSNCNCINYDENKLISSSVYIKGVKLENHIFEKHKYFAIDIYDGAPVSYEYINDNIPYILLKDVKKYKIERNNSKIKKLFKR